MRARGRAAPRSSNAPRAAACRRATARHGPGPPSRHRPPNDRSPPATAPARQGRRKRPAQLLHQGAVAGRHRLAIGHAANAAAGHRADIACRHRLEAALRGRIDDGARQPMLGMALQSGRPCEHLVASAPSLSMPTRRGSARGQRAGLVESDEPRCAPGPRARRDRGRGSRTAPAVRCRARSRSARRGRPRRDRRPPAPQVRSAAPGRTAMTAPSRGPSAPPRTRTSGTEMPTTRSATRWVGLRRDSASRTDRQICAQRVAVPAPLLSDQQRPVEIDAAGDHRRADAL